MERFNRTIKTLMFRAFTQNGNHKWIDIIQDLLESYNETVHSATKFRPNEVNESNESQVRKNLYPPEGKKRRKKPDFALGDTVRISRKDHVFRKGYEKTMSDEVFIVSGINDTRPVTYKLKSFDGEPIYGSFYSEEMQFVDKTDNVYQVERIIKKRVINGKTQYRVKYLGFGNNYNEWVDEENLMPV